jgi:hypothetical protein
MNEANKDSGKGWVRRALRAVAIAFAIYYMMSLSIGYVMKKPRIGFGQQGAEQAIKDLHLPPGQLPPNEADLAVRTGYAWASEHDVRSHAECGKRWLDANHDSLARSGCSKYVTEQNVLKVSVPIPPRRWDETTAECVANVHAYWDPVIDDMSKKGEIHAAGSWMSRTVMPALNECQNLDNIRIARVVYEPQTRIDEILKRVRNGGAITEEDKQTVRTDYLGAFSFPENSYRTQYLNSAEEFFKLAGGRDQVL